MLTIPYDKIIEKIKEKADITDSEIDSKIKQKLDQLSGLISKEGAAHIIANELGVKLFEAPKGGLKIKDVLTGMRDLEIVGKIQQIFNVTEFEKGDRKGKVGSFVIAASSAHAPTTEYLPGTTVAGNTLYYSSATPGTTGAPLSSSGATVLIIASTAWQSAGLTGTWRLLTRIHQATTATVYGLSMFQRIA